MVFGRIDVGLFNTILKAIQTKRIFYSWIFYKVISDIHTQVIIIKTISFLFRNMKIFKLSDWMDERQIYRWIYRHIDYRYIHRHIDYRYIDIQIIDIYRHINYRKIDIQIIDRWTDRYIERKKYRYIETKKYRYIERYTDNTDREIYR